MKKRCAKCQEEKPTEDFHKQRTAKDGLFCYCKPCANTYSRAHKKRNYSADQKRRWLLSTRYGITPADFDRMMDGQNGKCAICDQPMNRVCVDHDHATGLVRGLLCHGCNIKLPAIEDVAYRTAADSYLESHKLRCAS